MSSNSHGHWQLLRVDTFTQKWMLSLCHKLTNFLPVESAVMPAAPKLPSAALGHWGGGALQWTSEPTALWNLWPGFWPWHGLCHVWSPPSPLLVSWSPPSPLLVSWPHSAPSLHETWWQQHLAWALLKNNLQLKNFHFLSRDQMQHCDWLCLWSTHRNKVSRINTVIDVNSIYVLSIEPMHTAVNLTACTSQEHPL